MRKYSDSDWDDSLTQLEEDPTDPDWDEKDPDWEKAEDDGDAVNTETKNTRWKRQCRTAPPAELPEADNPAPLVAQALQGSERAWSDLYNNSRECLFSTAYHIVKNWEDAEDVLSETYIKAFQKLSRLSEPERFYGWLTTICRNEAISWQRSRKRRAERGELPLSFSQMTPGQMDMIQYPLWGNALTPEEICLQDEDRKLCRKVLRALPPDLADVLWKKDIQNMTYKEISEETGVNENTLKYRHARALEKGRAIARELSA